MMFKIGDRVHLNDGNDQFDNGTIHSYNVEDFRYLVKWDSKKPDSWHRGKSLELVRNEV